jgi:hypothetical protein
MFIVTRHRLTFQKPSIFSYSRVMIVPNSIRKSRSSCHHHSTSSYPTYVRNDKKGIWVFQEIRKGALNERISDRSEMRLSWRLIPEEGNFNHCSSFSGSLQTSFVLK